MTTRYTIWPLRFSPNPTATIEFFTALGLRKTLSDAEGTFATLEGRSGKLGVHSAAHTASGALPGHTALNFTTADIMAAAQNLTAEGLQVKVWDESYGKQGLVTTPDGLVIGLNENTQDDLYGGYQVHEHTVPASMEVVAICRSDDIAREAAFFAAFGFTAHSAAGLPGLALQADQGSGVLHLLRGDALSPRKTGPAGDQFGPPYVVDLWFQASEPLDALTARLQDAGYPATIVQNAKGQHVSLTDPDGEEIQVHPTP